MRRVRYADESHVEKLTALWAQAFGDDEDYIRSFLACQLRDRFSYIVTEDDAKDSVIAMAHAFPCRIRTPQADYDFVYLYAVATLQSYQGMGVASEMLAQIHLDLKEKGYFGTFLFPADERLFRYYERLGYRLKGYCKKLDLPFEGRRASTKGICSDSKITNVRCLKCEEIAAGDQETYANRLNLIKERHYAAHSYEHWEKKHAAFMLQDSAYEKRRILFFEIDGEECFLVFKLQESRIIVSESAMREEAFNAFYQELALCAAHFCEAEFEGQTSACVSSIDGVEYTLPYWFAMGKEVPKAMIYALEEEPDFLKFMPNNSL